MIDPNIWGSEDMAKLTTRQRLLVIGLFSNADDYGKGKAKPTYVRSMIFPYDDIEITEVISDLDRIKTAISIVFYEVDGNSYYKFVNWDKWQTVQKPQDSLIPEPLENHSGLGREWDYHDPYPGAESFSPKGKEEKGKEVGKEGKGKDGENDSPQHSTFNDPIKDRIHTLVIQCEIKAFNIVSADELFLFIEKVEIEVIEAAIKKAYKKHMNYAVNTLKDWVSEGKTTSASINLTPIGGDPDGKQDATGGNEGRASSGSNSLSSRFTKTE